MINYSILEIKRAIFHKVMAKRAGSDPCVVESDTLRELTTDMKDILRKRMSDAFGSAGRAFELTINDVEDGSVYSMIHNLCNEDDNVFYQRSIDLANKLALSQNKISIPHGFFVLLDCVNPVDNMPVYVMMKAEPHDAVEITQSLARAINNIILSPSQKMYKAGCFQQFNTEEGHRGYRAYLFDEQFGSRAHLAEYFYRDFLGLTVSTNDKVLTKLFFVKMIDAIKDRYKNDYLRKNDADEVLNAEMNNQNTTLNPRDVIDRAICIDDRDYFYRRVLSDEMPPSFRKNISLIDSRMMNRSMLISDDIKICAPQGLFQDNSFVIDRETDNDYVIVKIRKN